MYKQKGKNLMYEKTQHKKEGENHRMYKRIQNMTWRGRNIEYSRKYNMMQINIKSECVATRRRILH